MVIVLCHYVINCLTINVTVTVCFKSFTERAHFSNNRKRLNEKMAAVATILSLVLILIGACQGFPSGAPSSACQSMLPGHRTQSQNNAINPCPYAIFTDATTYKPNTPIEIMLHSLGNEKLRGFILEARKVSDFDEGPVGTFIDPTTFTKTICDQKALTFRTWSARDEFKATWLPPAGEEDLGDVIFVATMVKSYNTFWLGIRSHVLTKAAPPPPPPSPIPLESGLATNHTTLCADGDLLQLPVGRPHVAILCSESDQCPCGWLCCPSCTEDTCAGHAICRQPLSQNVTDREQPVRVRTYKRARSFLP